MEKVVDYVMKKVEDRYWIADGLQEEYFEIFRIYIIGAESDGSSDEESTCIVQAVIVIRHTCINIDAHTYLHLLCVRLVFLLPNLK